MDVLAFAGDVFGDLNNANDDTLEINISANEGGTASSFIGGLLAGTYRAVVEVYRRSDNTALSWTDTVTQGIGDTAALSKTVADFVSTLCDAVVATGSTLAAKLDAALGAVTGNSTIVLDGTETDLGSFAGKTLSGSKTIAIRGNGHAVQLKSGAINPLLTVEGGLKLALHDVTLRGATNAHPLV